MESAGAPTSANDKQSLKENKNTWFSTKVLILGTRGLTLGVKIQRWWPAEEPDEYIF